MYLFEGYCLGGTVQVQGPESDTIQGAADAFAAAWANSCPGDGLVNPISWTGDGVSNFAETNVPFGWAVDLSGNSWASTGYAATWVIPDVPPASDPSFSFLAACGLVVLFALGYIGGHQR